MALTGVDQKLRIFISSKCGGKYTIARKALKTILESTGLIEAYAFETAPASSEDTISAYLEYVDASNLCIFLVDNADGVPAAVLSEEKRAKDKGLRLLYLFCDEDKKEATPMQSEVRVSQSCKYVPVHEFADFVEKAYSSVMQDLIVIYRKKKDGASDEYNEKDEENNQMPITQLSQEIYSLQKEKYSKYKHVTNKLMDGILINSSEEDLSTIPKLECLLIEQLEVVLHHRIFNADSFKSLKDEVLATQNSSIKEFIEKRLDAQLYYFQAEYDKCHELLKEALIISLNNSTIPTWLTNDIAIDIRHVIGRIDEMNNRFTIDNPGQKLIDESREPLFYPFLDRQIENMQEGIANRYYKELTGSPYSTQLGGLEEIFGNLGSAFCIAQMHGSIVQTIITEDRLIAITLMLCTLYNDHDYLVELIRLLIVNQDSKKLDSVIRTYNQTVDIINNTDVKKIMDSIQCIPNQIHMHKAKYLLASRLGYYMNDNLYNELCRNLIDYANNWVHEEKPINSLAAYLFDFFRMNTYRANLAQAIDFIIAVFEKGMNRFYDNCFKILLNTDFSRMTLEYQRKIKSLLMNILSGKIECHDIYACLQVCIRFCKGAAIPYKQLEKHIEKKYPAFYSNVYELEILIPKGADPTKYIEMNLTDADKRNETQGKNGEYVGYKDEPYEVIYNIISFVQGEIKKDIAERIIKSAINTLSEKKQTIDAKKSAISLLQLIYYRTKSAAFWKNYKQQIIENRTVYISGYEMGLFEKASINVLSFSYDLLVSCFDSKAANQAIEDLFCLDQQKAIEIIGCLNTVSSYLENGIGSIFNEKLHESFLCFSIMMMQHRERDIKYYSTKCLVGLTQFEKTRDMALKQLSQIMNTGSENAKIAILMRVGKIKDKSCSFVEQVFNKGKADNNSLVRFVAEREYNKNVSE